MRPLLAIASIAAVLGLATAAQAAPPPTPNGWIGACNMNSSWPGLSPANENGVAVRDGGGMMLAMERDNPNGNAGMFRAVERSGDQDC
jgi:hypothetical protein